MKKTLIAGLALAGFAMATNANAQSYTFGDSLLLFRIDQTASSSVTGYSKNVAIDLGNLNSDYFSYNLSGSSLSTLLDSTFGSGWQNNGNLVVGVLAATSNSVVTSYQTTDSPAFANSAWSYINSYNGQMVGAFRNDSTISSVTDSKGVAHWASVIDITSTGAAGAANFTIFDDPSYSAPTGFGGKFAGSIGSNLTAADANSTVDLVLNTYTKGALNDHSNGDVTIDSTGQISVNTVPEPSTYALIGFGALLLVVAYRRSNA
jgi:hypothetical protein